MIPEQKMNLISQKNPLYFIVLIVPKALTYRENDPKRFCLAKKMSKEAVTFYILRHCRIN